MPALKAAENVVVTSAWLEITCVTFYYREIKMLTNERFVNFFVCVSKVDKWTSGQVDIL